jgi:hypothetical protein
MSKPPKARCVGTVISGDGARLLTEAQALAVKAAMEKIVQAIIDIPSDGTVEWAVLSNVVVHMCMTQPEPETMLQQLIHRALYGIAAIRDMPTQGNA